MSDLGSNDEGMDRLLRRSMSVPIPSLPPDFDQRLMRELNRNPRELDRSRMVILTVYSVVSAGVCAAVMRGQGLGWGATGALSLAPMSLVAVALVTWSKAKKTYSAATH